MKTQSEIRINPLQDPCRLNLILEKEQLTQLKLKAAFHNTTVNEILRSLVTEYLQKEEETLSKRIFFRICYGIKSFNSDGSERPHDTMISGTLYVSIEEALNHQEFWFDGMCEELKRHSPRQRQKEQAFCYIEAITGITDNTPDGEDAFHLLDAALQKTISSAYLTLSGNTL